MRRHRGAGGIFQGLSRAAEVFAKFGWRKLIDEAMPIAVRADFVPTGVDLPHQSRMAVSNPAEDEKSGFDAVTIQQTKHAVRVGLHAALPAVPVVAADVLFKCGDLVIVLHIDRKGVCYLPPASTIHLFPLIELNKRQSPKAARLATQSGRTTAACRDRTFGFGAFRAQTIRRAVSSKRPMLS